MYASPSVRFGPRLPRYDRSMCRVLAYLGEPISLEARALRHRQLARPPVLQPADDEHLPEPRGLRDGRLGRRGRSSAEEPFIYRTTTLPNVRPQPARLGRKLEPTCLLAHVRGVTYGERELVASSNLHPFRFPGAQVVMAHNGHLREFRAHALRPRRRTSGRSWPVDRGHDRLGVDLRARALAARRPATACRTGRARRRDRGRAADPARLRARERHRHVLAGQPVPDDRARRSSPRASRSTTAGTRTRTRCSRATCRTSASGTRRAAVRRVQRRVGTWSATSAVRSLLIASEPLTVDISTWLEVPEYSLLTAQRTPEGARLRDARPRCLTEQVVDFLATVPLFEGIEEAALAELARAMRRRAVAGGRVPVATGGRGKGHGR